MLSLSSMLVGCVMVPAPASVNDAELPVTRAQIRLSPAESVAVIGAPGTDDAEGDPECVRNAIRDATGEMGTTLRVLEPAEFEEFFYPWFDPVRRPQFVDALEAVLQDPTVQQRIAELALRYLISVTGQITKDEIEGPAIPHLLGGVATYHRAYELQAEIWDLREAKSAGQVVVGASGAGAFLGYGFYGMWAIPRAGSAACRGVGRTLAAILTGAELPEQIATLLKSKEKQRAAEEAKLEAEKTARRKTLEASAAQGDRVAIFALAREFDESLYLIAPAEQGDVEAAIELARITGDTRLLEKAASEGDLAAARALAATHGIYAPLTTLASLDSHKVSGNPNAAWGLFKDLYPSSRVEEEVVAWKALCMAAAMNHPAAQSEVGYWHRTDVWENLMDGRAVSLRTADFKPDNRLAYMWYTLAAENGDSDAVRHREYVISADMTPRQIMEAEQMARNWKPGDCPN